MREDTELDAEQAAVQSRAEGCLLGQCAGDALGSMVEFQSVEYIRMFPGGLHTISGSPVFGTIAGQPTDNSEMALALAHTLVQHGWDPELVANAYAHWLESNPFDVGNTVGRALRAAVHARKQGKSLSQAAMSQGSKQSEANGALMRQSPLAVWGYALPPEQLDEYVRADTRLTHFNPVCEDASSAFIAALAAVIREGLDGKGAYRVACLWDEKHGSSPTVSAALRRAATEPPDYLTHVGHVIVALQNAFYMVLHAPSMEEGVIRTVLGGGDTDTNAAIAGALLGAVYGREQVPAQWQQVLRDCRPKLDDPGVHKPRPEEYWPNNLVGVTGLAYSLIKSDTNP